MKIKQQKVEGTFLHLTFDSRRDRDKFYDYIEENLK